MSIGAKEIGLPAVSRLPAHLIGFLGANLLCAAFFLWGNEVVRWLESGRWSPSPLGRLVMRLAGGADYATLVAMDGVAGLCCLAGGALLLVAGARLLVQRGMV